MDTDPRILLIAGLLSTIEFRPSDYHPEKCIPIAEQVLALAAADAVDDSWEPQADEIKTAAFAWNEWVNQRIGDTWNPMNAVTDDDYDAARYALDAAAVVRRSRTATTEADVGT